jgi:hypothetical protein
MLKAAADKYSLPPELLAAVAQQESRGNPKAVSPKGAIGVMQIMPATARGLGVRDPRALFDPATNIDAGARYLRQLLDQFKDPRLALAAYNAGPGAVQRYGGVPPYRETQGYTRSILDQVNGTRRNLGIPTPVDASQLPSTAQMISPPPVAEQAPVAAQAPPAITAPASYAARDEAADSAAAANAAPGAAKPRLNQVWQPPAPPEIADAQNQIKELQASHVSMQERQRALFSQENLDTLNTAAKVLIGERPDYSQYSGAIQKVMGIAEKNLHPSIGGVLMQFGLALMSSPSHNVGQAIGQAGSVALQGYQEQKQQATKDYLAAINAGINLQDKTNDYDAKIGQYKMHRLDAQQRGIELDERAYQQQLGGLYKDLVKAQSDFEKKTATPALKQSAATAFLNDHNAVLDPQLNDPYAQVGRDFGLEAQQSLTGTAKSAPKVDKVTERLAEVNKARELQGLPVMTNINGLPKAEQDYITRGAKPAAVKPSIFDPTTPEVAAPGVAMPDVTPGAPAPATAVPGAAVPSKPAADTGPPPPVPLAPPPGGYNEKVLESIPNENARTLVKGIATYQIAPPNGTASKDPDWLKALVLAKQYDPSFDANQYKIRYDLMKDFSPGGKSGQNLLSAEQLVHHLDRMTHSWDRLQNWGGIAGGLANAPFNWMRGAAHTPEMTAFEVDRKAVSDELMKYLRGSGAASEREAKDWENRLSPNAPPESQAAAMQELYGLLGARLKLTKDQFEATMGRPADFSAKFKPETVELLRKNGVDMGLPGAKPAAPAAPPAGGKIVTKAKVKQAAHKYFGGDYEEAAKSFTDKQWSIQ